MSRVDMLARTARENAMRAPLTRANQGVVPGINLPNGVYIAVTVNK